MYVPRSRIEIAYVCGNRFRYLNNSSEAVILTY